MTQEEKRIKIAEACGTMKWSHALPNKEIHCDVPDYFNDLNACHEIEKWIYCSPTNIVGRYSSFDKHLHNIVANDFANKIHWSLHVLHATAAQRCEAFGKALNLW